MRNTINDSEFVVRIHRAALEPARYNEILNELAETFGLAQVEILVYAEADDTPRFLCRSRARASAAAANGEPGMAGNDRDREMHLRAPLDDGCLLQLSAVVDGHGAALSRVVRERCAALLPAFQHSLRVWLRLARAQGECADLRRVLDTCRFGVILLDSCGRRVHLNSEAQRHLARGDILREHAGGIAAATVPANRVFQELLARAQRGDEAGECVLYARDDDAASYLDVLLQPVAGEHIGSGTGQASVALYLLDTVPEIQRVDAHDFLHRRYGLTQREADCALRIGAGASISSAARAMNIAPHTARSHLRSIFNKTGIRRQTELVVLLARCANRLHAVVRAVDSPRVGGSQPALRAASRASAPTPPHHPNGRCELEIR